MAVRTPLSLNYIFTEFDAGVISTSTFNSGSGTVTPPADAAAARIYVWGGGGGGGNGGEFYVGGGGGGGGFTFKQINSVTPGVTSFSYSVGAGGFGNIGNGALVGTDGGSSSVSVNSVTYSAFGGFGGDAPAGFGVGGAGGMASGGDINITGSSGSGALGGAAGGTIYGGGAGGNGGAGIAPGGGGAGDQSQSFDGAAGRVKIEWLGKKLSTYTRGGGSIPNHSANLNIPTTTTGLSISDFSEAEKDFTAIITHENPVGDSSISGYSFTNQLSCGSITRTQVGRSRVNLDYYTIVAAYEVTQFNWFTLQFDNFLYVKFQADSALTPFFSQVRFQDSSLASWAFATDFYALTRSSAYNGASGTYDNVEQTHTWYWYLGSTEGSFYIANGSNRIRLLYEGA